ncbi:MAG TPA: hypothetical protein VG271_02385 [Beijerinckiaceae bacterium]|nr:hypothetical protein [Beijerinckiaceae bacterium]
MLQLLDPGNYSVSMLAVIGFGVICGGSVAGYVTDMIMGERGFGFFGNAFLTMSGCGSGIYTRHVFFGWWQGEETLIVGTFALSTATLILLLFGLVKARV